MQNIQLLSNGTLALQLAIKSLELKREIITTPYSYVATTNAIVWEGCTPIFVDIDPKTFCINPELIEIAITEHTTAILTTHVYGYPCDVKRIQEIADKHGLKVIYDAAHAFGVRLHGESLLNHGDCSTLSFHATKLFHTAEGGAIISNSTLSDRIAVMCKFGHIGEDEYLDIGINAKMSELHAAMGLAVLKKVPEIIAERRKRAEWYDEMLDGLDLVRPKVVVGLEYNYAYYPVVFSSYQRMMAARKALQAEGICPQRYFYPSLNTLPFLPQAQQKTCLVSESIALRVLALPLYPMLDLVDVERVVKCIKSSV